MPLRGVLGASARVALQLRGLEGMPPERFHSAGCGMSLVRRRGPRSEGELDAVVACAKGQAERSCWLQGSRDPSETRLPALCPVSSGARGRHPWLCARRAALACASQARHSRRGPEGARSHPVLRRASGR